MLFMSSRVQHSVRGIIDYILVFDYINWLDLWSFTVFQIEHNSPDTPNLPGRFYLSHESRPSQAVQLQYVKEKQRRKLSQQHVHVLTTRDPVVLPATSEKIYAVTVPPVSRFNLSCVCASYYVLLMRACVAGQF